MTQPTFTGLRSFLQLPKKLEKNKKPDITILGIPFDLGTTNRPGARFGPSAVRDASLMLLDGDNPHFRLDPIQELKMIDIGDLNIVNSRLEKSLDLIYEQVNEIKSHIVSIGGDHTITLSLLRALKKKYEKPISIVHFDAHVDTWSDNFGTTYGHGTTFYYAVEGRYIDPKHSVQIGIRSPVQNEVMDYTQKDACFNVITSEMVHRTNIDIIINGIKNTVGDNLVYLTFDIDCIDPSQAPGTGTPEIGGLFTWQVLSILNKLEDLNWVGMDLVEVAPAYDHAQITSLAGATIIWTYLSLLAKRKNNDRLVTTHSTNTRTI